MCFQEFLLQFSILVLPKVIKSSNYCQRTANGVNFIVLFSHVNSVGEKVQEVEVRYVFVRVYPCGRTGTAKHTHALRLTGETER